MADVIAGSLIPTVAGPIAREGHFLLTVGDGVEWLRVELRWMHDFLSAVETSAVETSAVGDAASIRWVEEIRDIIYDSTDIIDVFDAIATHPVSCFFCYLRSRHQVGRKIQEIKSRLDDFSRRREEYKIPAGAGGSKSVDLGDRWIHGLLDSCPVIHQGDIVGFEEDFGWVLDWVTTSDDEELNVLSLVGMGGVGKTTLIKKVFNHSDVKRRFDHFAWIYVSKSFRLRNLVREVAAGLLNIPSSEVDAVGESQLPQLMLSTLEHKRFLLVLDDVWDKRVWEKIRLILPANGRGSRVIITTRNSEVASSVAEAKSCSRMLQPLSHEESWRLFCKKAFPASEPCPVELREAAEGIVSKCHGLPLAIAIVGGMMARKERLPAEWSAVLHDVIIGNEVDVQGPLFLSYKDLPYPLKSCFLMFSMFPQDSNISRKRLIRLWMAEGLIREGDREGERMEDVAEKYLMELINRSMIQLSIASSSGRVKTCRIHHLLHHLSISISKTQNFSEVFEEDKRSNAPMSACRVSLQKSSYQHLSKKGQKKLRSVLMFGVDSTLCIDHQFLSNLRLLRVLDLENACLNKLPSEVGDLIHLRYLSLKGTKLKMLPLSLKNLSNLLTLDITRTQLRKLPFELHNLKNLRHLEMKQEENSIKLPPGISQIQNLQVITGARADPTIVREISNLTGLRKLAIHDLQAEHAAELCSSLNSAAGLLSLSIFSIDVSTRIDLEELEHPMSLQKLHIAGCLQRLPHWFGGISNLVKLRLGLSGLSADPFETLERLPNLVFLQLYEAYQGKLMRCRRRGFPKLRILGLTDFMELEEWEVENGAMQCIQEVWIMSCSALKGVPAGLEFLLTLEQLRLVSMPEEFVRRLSSPGGEDFLRVRHVPTIQEQNNTRCVNNNLMIMEVDKARF